MKLKSFIWGTALMVAAVPGFSQDATVDDFESYITTADVQAKYVSVAGNGAEKAELGFGGANGTNQFLTMVDVGGFTAGIGATAIATPPAGTYRLSFYYKNGTTYSDRWRGIKVSLLENAAVVQEITVDPGTTSASHPAVTEWTYAETGPFTLTGNPVDIRFDTSNGAGDFYAYVDEIILKKIEGPAISVYPDHRIYLSGTETLVATPQGGSGTYTSVTFDVNGDDVIEHTATEAPWEFNWDTLVDVPAGTSRTLMTGNTPIDVKITVTDSNSETQSITESFTVDNRFNGRESMLTNGDFSQWTDGTNFGANLPVGWTTQDVSPTMKYGPSTDSHSPEAGTSLRVQLDGGETLRYAVRTEAVTGNYVDMQATWWGKGDGLPRMYYFTSDDDGATFVNTFQTAGETAGTVWTFMVEEEVQNNIGLDDTTQVSLATHTVPSSVNERNNYFDDVTWEGMLLPPADTSVDEWQLY